MERVKCEICGMYINDKNIFFNSSALLKRNDSNIYSCPFCGVSYNTFKNFNEADYKALDEKTIKILDHAMKLEMFNSEFYNEASKLAQDEHLQIMFKDLSCIELMHSKIHQKLGGFQKLPIIARINYGKYNEDKILLQQAAIREQHAISYYKKYSNEVCSCGIQRVFAALCEVEEEHIVLTSA